MMQERVAKNLGNIMAKAKAWSYMGWKITFKKCALLFIDLIILSCKESQIPLASRKFF